MFKFQYDYVHQNIAKLCCVDTDSFTVNVKIDDVYKYIAEDVETRFDTPNHELYRPLHKE